MIERYLVLAERIRQELADVEQVIERAERAMAAARQRPDDQDLYLDSVALNLHDFYVGLERVFHLIATTVDRSLPDRLGCIWCCRFWGCVAGRLGEQTYPCLLSPSGGQHQTVRWVKPLRHRARSLLGP